MCKYECGSPWCCVIGILAVIAWWLFASGLLLCAWNSVIAQIANVKKAKYWQALVIVLTIAVLCGPFVFSRHLGMNARHRHEYCQRDMDKSCCGSMRKPCEASPCDSMKHKSVGTPDSGTPKTGE